MTSAAALVYYTAERKVKYTVWPALAKLLETRPELRARYETTVDELKSLCDRYMYRLKAAADYMLEAHKTQKLVLCHRIPTLADARRDLAAPFQAVHTVTADCVQRVPEAFPSSFGAAVEQGVVPGESLAAAVTICEPKPLGADFDYAGAGLGCAGEFTQHQQTRLMRRGISATVPRPRKLRVNMMRLAKGTKLDDLYHIFGPASQRCGNASCSLAYVAAGTRLRRCPAPCLQNYCSDACQKADWQSHKKVCMHRAACRGGAAPSAAGAAPSSATPDGEIADGKKSAS